MMIPKARPIEDVIADLEPKLVRMLPGGQAVAGSWSAFCQARELLHMADMWLAKHDVETNETKKRAYDSYMWIKHGERAAAMRIIHVLADAFRVENVTWVEVPDVKEDEAVGSAE